MGKLQETYSITPPRVDFERRDFEQLIYQKGRKVLYEKALQCPCKSVASNQQSNCKHCGGTGWLYINPEELRLVITGVGVVNDYKPWSEESRGMINVSCPNSVELCFMDRLSLLDSEAIHQEVLQFMKTGNNEYIAYSKYPILKMLYSGKFIDVSTPLERLQESDFYYDRNLIRLNPQKVLVGEGESSDTAISITVRYQHHPIYHIIEMKRETMESFKYQEGEESLQRMPISGIARRAHYLQNAPILVGDRLIDNSYNTDGESCCLETQCCDEEVILFEPTTTTSTSTTTSSTTTTTTSTTTTTTLPPPINKILSGYAISGRIEINWDGLNPNTTIQLYSQEEFGGAITDTFQKEWEVTKINSSGTTVIQVVADILPLLFEPDTEYIIEHRHNYNGLGVDFSKEVALLSIDSNNLLSAYLSAEQYIGWGQTSPVNIYSIDSLYIQQASYQSGYSNSFVFTPYTQPFQNGFGVWKKIDNIETLVEDPQTFSSFNYLTPVIPVTSSDSEIRVIKKVDIFHPHFTQLFPQIQSYLNSQSISKLVMCQSWFKLT